jgi:hypothetical protein
MPWVYAFLTVFAGFFFYWLRRNHLIWYGASEIIASFALMYVAYFPHGEMEYWVGPGSTPPTFMDTATAHAVTFFATVYAFVRGCDNIVSALREPNN